MQVEWDEVIVDLTMLEVRDLARKLFYARSLEFIAAETGLSRSKALQLARTMKKRGWLRQAGPNAYETTIAGNALAMAKKLKPMSRAKAQTLLVSVVEEAVAINRDPDMVYDVTYLGVFGSYLGEGDALGDLDIAFDMRARWISHDEDGFHAMIDRANAAYPPPASWWALTRCAWPELFTRRRLKVSNRVSLHHKSEIDILGWQQQQVFGAVPTAAEASDNETARDDQTAAAPRPGASPMRMKTA